MKTKLLWSAVVLCGFVGAWVAYMGGWDSLIQWHPILITRVVWQTNYTSAVEDLWAKPARQPELTNFFNTIYITNTTAFEPLTNCVVSWYIFSNNTYATNSYILNHP